MYMCAYMYVCVCERVYSICVCICVCVHCSVYHYEISIVSITSAINIILELIDSSIRVYQLLTRKIGTATHKGFAFLLIKRFANRKCFSDRA